MQGRVTDRKSAAAAVVAMLAGLLVLQGCGGGGSDAPSATAPTPTPAPGTGADVTCGLPDFKAEMLRLVNDRRAAGASCGSSGNFPAVPALAWNDALTNAAYGHSKDMADQNYFAHTSKDGRSFSQRITDAGYSWSWAGENIAAGQSSVQAVVGGWMSSPGHCANIMSASARDIGVACARNDASDYKIYWTMDLARPL